jgi:tetratricopeptide (TPR) repeat protein
MESSTGGARAATGLTFQAEVFAWWAARAVDNAPAGLGLDPEVRIEAVGCETGFPVDDVGVALSNGGFVLIQAKSGMRRLEPRAQDLRMAVDQLVNAMISGIATDGSVRPVKFLYDRLMIATNQDASKSFDGLGVVCERLRNQPLRLPIEGAAKNETQRKALTAFLSIIRSSWAKATGCEPTDTELREFLRVTEVIRFDFKADIGADRLRSEALLERASVTEPFPTLVRIGIEAAQSRTWRRRDSLMSAVGMAHRVGDDDRPTSESASSDRPVLPIRLAPTPTYLAGRDDLLRILHDRLTASETSGPQVLALCGLGGIGKTSLAVSYAHRHLGSYGVVWQFPSGDALSLLTGYVELATDLDIGDRTASGVRALQEVFDYLAARTDRWLLIFDDAADPASLRDFLPPAGNGDIIITSTNASWPLTQRIPVPVLDAHDAAAFLMDRTGDTDAEAAADVASMLDGLPLALEQAGAYTFATGCGLSGYAELFKEHRSDMLVRAQPSDYEKTVATTWLAAFNTLQDTFPASIALLRLFACYGPFPIPLSLLLSQQPGLQGDIDGDVAAQVESLLADPLTLNDAVAALGSYSLIGIPVQGVVTVHRLVQDITRDQIPHEQLSAWRNTAAALLRSALPGDPELPENWQAFRVLIPHVLAILPALDMRQVVDFLRHTGNYGAAVVVQEHIAGDVLDQSGPNSAEFLIEMANLFFAKGEDGSPAEARDGFAGIMHGIEHTINPEEPFYLQLRSQLARWTGEAGNPAEACALYEDLMPVLERVLGDKDQRTLTARYNYAAALAESGDAAKARDLYASMIPLYENLFGLDHPDTLGVRANFAYSTGEAGEPARARELYMELLPAMNNILGPAHPKTVTDTINMAYMSAKVGDLSAAIDQLTDKLSFLEEVIGSTHTSTTRLKEFIDNLRDAALP